MIRGLIANTGVQTLVIIIIKILRDADLRVSQVDKNGPLTDFEHLRFEARPEALSLRVIITVAAAALRA
jgi:hypothetical protein